MLPVNESISIMFNIFIQLILELTTPLEFRLKLRVDVWGETRVGGHGYMKEGISTPT